MLGSIPRPGFIAVVREHLEALPSRDDNGAFTGAHRRRCSNASVKSAADAEDLDQLRPVRA